MTLPAGSQIETIVLLKVLLMCAWSCPIFLRSFRRTFLTPVRLLGGILLLYLAEVVGPVAVPAPCAGGQQADYFLPVFFLPATVFFLPLRVRALVCVR